MRLATPTAMPSLALRSVLFGVLLVGGCNNRAKEPAPREPISTPLPEATLDAPPTVPPPSPNDHPPDIPRAMTSEDRPRVAQVTTDAGVFTTGTFDGGPGVVDAGIGTATGMDAAGFTGGDAGGPSLVPTIPAPPPPPTPPTLRPQIPTPPPPPPTPPTRSR